MILNLHKYIRKQSNYHIMNPDHRETRNFLNRVRSAIKRLNYEILDSREKYRKTIAELGILDEDVLDDICQLTEFDNWSKDRDDNSKFSGDVWKCIKRLHNSDIYVKLKIKVDENGKLLIMSYHFDNML